MNATDAPVLRLSVNNIVAIVGTILLNGALITGGLMRFSSTIESRVSKLEATQLSLEANQRIMLDLIREIRVENQRRTWPER